MVRHFFLRQNFSHALYIDLLSSKQFVKYAQNPSILGEELERLDPKTLIIIDEVQKVPELLDEVHRLIESRGLIFGLCGSSARKLKRGQANLLGGRALRFEMFGLISQELDGQFDFVRLCNTDNIPNHYLSEQYWDLLESYIGDYLKEEILAEALVRSLPSFSDFLRAAAISDTELIDYTNIASECGVKSPTVKNYYEILSDTLQGFFLPAFTKRPKRKVIHAPKFYFANVGVVNWLAKRKLLEPGSSEFGKAFENLIVNEIRAWNSYHKAGHHLAYWKLASGAEVDLVIEDLGIAIEIKTTRNISNKHLDGLRELILDQPKLNRRMVVSLEERSRVTTDLITIYSVTDFLDALWDDFSES